jgi:DNA-binding SARP family transcriptional activator/tetratricopeptide (TPR) repeat protein/DNA-binding XRE family transcriptional regulator
MSFAALLRRHRQRFGLSQRELATRAGLGLSTVRDLEQGRTRQPQPPSVRALTIALGLDENCAAELRDAAVVREPAWTRPAHQEGSVRLDVLGPLTLRRGTVELAFGRGGRRLLLARLALSANTPVPVHELVDLLWGDKPPRDPHQLLQSYVSRLRLALDHAGFGQPADTPLIMAANGYRLMLAEQQLDMAEFRGLVHAAQQTDPQNAIDLLEQALQLWRDIPPVSDVFEMRDHPLVTALVQEHVAVALRYADLTSELGAYERSLPRLRNLATAHSLHEPVHARLVTALAGAGLQAEALAAYDGVRRRLADDLGIDPGPELAGVHRRVLRQEVIVVSSQEPPHHTPKQLPAPAQLFTGRTGELADLDKIHDASTVVIAAVDGMAGVGKTALAVQAAHQAAPRYPDGQLFIDLHGYTAGVTPTEPGEALDYLLRSLGVPGERIPADLDQRAGLYRSRLAGQRVLILLDNAADEAQVTPLLPGAPGCLVVVTSRRRLPGLDHTHTLSLHTLPLTDAVALFERSTSQIRLADPPDMVVELVELCGRLPLAIRIAAARLRSHSTWDLAHLVRRLRDQQQRLAELAAGQRSVTAALDLSYQDLAEELRRAYRLLGLHFGVTIDSYAAAALLDCTLPEASRLLEGLLEAHLLDEPVPGRYRFHDLTRAHAAHTALADETDDDSRAAVDRLLDYYRYTAAVANDAAYPYERKRRPQVPPALTASPALSDPTVALGWLNAELPNLLAAAKYATEHDRPAHLLHLSATVHRHLLLRGLHHEAVLLLQQALTAARATGDSAAEVEAVAGLGHVHRLQGRYEEAVVLFEQALRLARTTGHSTGEVDGLVGLSHILRLQSQYETAIDHLERALLLARAAGYDFGEQFALMGLGVINLTQGTSERAVDYYQQALQLARATGHRPGEQYALTCLAYVHRGQGRYRQAADEYQALLDLAHEDGDLNFEFEARQGLGRLEYASGHIHAALAHHGRALALACELGQPSDEARAQDGLAHAYHSLNQPQKARLHWQHALNILTRVGIGQTDDQETNVEQIQTHLADLTK